MGRVAEFAGRHRWQHLMSLLWMAFTTAYFAFFYIFQDAGEIADASLDGYLEVVLIGVPVVILLGANMWLREADTDTDLEKRLIGWTLGVAILFLVAIYTVLFVIETAFDFGERWLFILMSLGFGASAGAVMGVLDIGEKQSERERRQAAEIAKRKEQERSKLQHLNQYLRHEVLNEANKITGYATLLAREVDSHETKGDYIQTIKRSSTEIAEFIESIRMILDASDHDPELTSIDIVATLESIVEEVERTHSSATIDIDSPPSAHALAGDLVRRVFRNLIENSIEHNHGSLSMTISVESEDDWITVRLRDNGSGIPPEEQERLFDPPESGDHGYGLFLMRNLVELYGGRLKLSSTGPNGTEFVVYLLVDTDTTPPSRIAEVVAQ